MNYQQTEKRNDIGIVKMAKLNEHNARENNLDHLNKGENFDNDLIFPDIDATKPNKKRGPKYHQPTDKQPPHLPDKELYPEEWAFYNYDLNDVRRMNPPTYLYTSNPNLSDRSART